MELSGEFERGPSEFEKYLMEKFSKAMAEAVNQMFFEELYGPKPFKDIFIEIEEAWKESIIDDFVLWIERRL